MTPYLKGYLEEWQYPPYSGKITNEDIWGRGFFSDNKGAAVMQLFSLLNIKPSIGNFNTEYNVTLLSVSCEETQCEDKSTLLLIITLTN